MYFTICLLLHVICNMYVTLYMLLYVCQCCCSYIILAAQVLSAYALRLCKNAYSRVTNNMKFVYVCYNICYVQNYIYMIKQQRISYLDEGKRNISTKSYLCGIYFVICMLLYVCQRCYSCTSTQKLASHSFCFCKNACLKILNAC